MEETGECITFYTISSKTKTEIYKNVKSRTNLHHQIYQKKGQEMQIELDNTYICQQGAPQHRLNKSNVFFGAVIFLCLFSGE